MKLTRQNFDMELSELRIGSYYVNKPQWSERISKGVFKLSRNDLYWILECELMDDIHPLPLTENRLKKLGFEFTYDTHLPYQKSYKLDDLLLSEDYTMSCMDEHMITFGRALKYVHQLQGICFTLIGKELTFTK